MNKILVLGGYGNFGWRISRAFAKDGIPFVIAGRSEQKALKLADSLQKQYPSAKIETAIFDVNSELEPQLESIKPKVVINTCGPFQTADYSVAETCVKCGVNYIDLADGRDFVNGIKSLDKQAKEAGVLVISGASTVPGLSSAVLEEYKNEFSEIDSLIFGIAPGAKAPRGLATTKAILTYVGKPLKPFAGSQSKVYGWQDLYRQKYPEIGTRWMANCEIPDLDLLPEKYGIKSIRFSAGMESSLLHLSIWLISWLVRLGLPVNLPKHAEFLWKLSNIFDPMGTVDGGMHMLIKGKDKDGNKHERNWFIIGKKNEGPNIPTIPAIIIAKKIITVELNESGAMPCVGMVTLAEYMEELKEFNIKTYLN
ncbi:MAG: saccharopine dehydrogenase [Alphaproteobacteria bacterium CG11_big_fil_rev_8_21_14_0_20_39_49]|nr:MAG: saccharopine dehydrogenase [Alphaproteobacteria bacterium CG11_big_fil_rev_8_21_14_0_20_39_49]